MCVGFVAEELKYESLMPERGRQTTIRLLTGKIPFTELTNSLKRRSGQVSAYLVKLNSREQLVRPIISVAMVQHQQCREHPWPNLF